QPDPAPDAPLTPPAALPDDTLAFTLPSRCVESDHLAEAAGALFGDTPATWARVAAITDWVHANVRYDAGLSTPHATATDTYRSRTGVCRDFALLAIAFCRALDIPARYTFGYIADVDPTE